jgi:hypothetical protein
MGDDRIGSTRHCKFEHKFINGVRQKWPDPEVDVKETERIGDCIDRALRSALPRGLALSHRFAFEN